MLVNFRSILKQFVQYRFLLVVMNVHTLSLNRTVELVLSLLILIVIAR